MRYIKRITLSNYDLEGELSNVIAKLQELQNKYGPTARLDSEISHGYYDSFDVEFHVSTNESKEERTDREAFEASRQALQKANEYQQYLRLRDQFEKNVVQFPLSDILKEEK